MRSQGAPAYSTRELQAAAAALAAGRFSGTSAAQADPQSDMPDPSWGELAVETLGPAPLVRVQAAHAGAGASTVALALADAADADGVATRVLDAAAPAWSGLSGATATELGATDGWRRGRRGTSLTVDRVEAPVPGPCDVPPPRRVDAVDLTVLDAGWSTRELATASGTWIATLPATVDVVVTRAHELALSQLEATLAIVQDRAITNRAALDRTGADPVAGGRVVVVVVARRRRAAGLSMAGPRLRSALEQDAVLFAPLLSAPASPHLGPDRLPKPLTAFSQRLLEGITTTTGPPGADAT